MQDDAKDVRHNLLGTSHKVQVPLFPRQKPTGRTPAQSPRKPREAVPWRPKAGLAQSWQSSGQLASARIRRLLTLAVPQSGQDPWHRQSCGCCSFHPTEHRPDGDATARSRHQILPLCQCIPPVRAGIHTCAQQPMPKLQGSLCKRLPKVGLGGGATSVNFECLLSSSPLQPSTCRFPGNGCSCAASSRAEASSLQAAFGISWHLLL